MDLWRLSVVKSYFYVKLRHYWRRFVNTAIIGVCDSVYDSLCVWFCPRDKTKTAKTKIAKLGTGIVHRHTSPANEY